LVSHLTSALAKFEKTRAHHVDGLVAEAQHYKDEVLPGLLELRKIVDELEGNVADDLWPMPTYEEILFISK
jgi:glutamine synthetase